MKVVYEDNHLLVVSKLPGEIVHADKTGDPSLEDMVALYLKKKYNKPGNVFVGVVHRLDRPVGGLVLFAKTSKALARMNKLFAEGGVHKTYRAVVQNSPKGTPRRVYRLALAQCQTKQNLHRKRESPRCQAGAPSLATNCHSRALPNARNRATDGETPPNTSTTCGDGMPNQGRP